MSNFRGYNIKINGCEFSDPQLSSYEFSPALVQVTDAGVLASGKLNIKVLPHTRRVIKCGFPPMPASKFRVYWNALKGNEAGKGMRLPVEAYDDINDVYVIDTYYHNDLTYHVLIADGKRQIQIHDFELIGH